MSDPVGRQLERERSTRLYDRVPLSDKLELPSGERVEAVLCRTPHGAYIVPADNGADGSISISDASEVRYESGLVQDRIVVDDRSFSVSPGRGRAARELLAVSRLAPAKPRPGRHAHSVTVSPPDTLAAAYLDGALDPDEELLVWLPLGKDDVVPSTWGRDSRAEPFLLITERRAARLVIGELGDVRNTVLEPAGRSMAQLGEIEEPIALRCSALVDFEGAARRLAVAALNWRHREERPAYRARAAMLIRGLVRQDDPLGALTAFFLGGQLALEGAVSSEGVDDALTRLKAPGRLGPWWSDFELSVPAGMLLVERARALELPPSSTLQLHEALWETALEGADPLEAGRADLELAEHYAAAGMVSEAEELIQTRLDALPRPRVDDFLPDERRDLKDVRRRALSLLATVSERRRQRALTRLVQRAPLEPSSLRRLSAEGRGWAAEAAAQVEALLEPGGIAGVRPSPAFKAHALEPEQVLALEHPATRESSTLGALQAYLAVAHEPDRSSLRAFCERLSTDEHPEATSALADAVLMLGAPTIDAFVSRGEKGVGIRAYEGLPPFLLVGGHHLASEGPFQLSARELRFAIASEVAHVRFKHRRMTPGEVWTGAWEKSRAGLDLVFTLLPAFKGWDMAEKLLRAVTLTRSAVGKVDKAARKRIREESLGVRLDDLVEAHRLMQLTADRAGLLLAGDLGSAVRAMFLLDPTLRPELALIERHGLGATLMRRDEEGELYFPDLLLRTAALIGFYVSGTWSRLARSVRGEVKPASDNKPS